MSDHVNPESLTASDPSFSSTADSAPETAPGAAAQLASAREDSSAANEIAPPPATTTVEGSAGDAPSEHEAAPDLSSENSAGEPGESFADALQAFERSHTHRAERQQLEGRVVSVSAEQVFLDIGYKMEGVLPRSAFSNNAEEVKPGDTFPVSITGRNEENYYELSRFRVAQPRDWSALERAFAEKLAVAGTVTGLVKGGLTVDVGVRAFMPASRSGTHDAAAMEALVGHQIECRITKLDVTDEDVVVDRRAVLEEQARSALAGRRAALKEGETVTGTVRSLASYGAFVEIGALSGLEGLLHISDISYSRIARPEDVLSIGQEVRVRILKVDPETKKISLGLKQLEPEPWEIATERYQPGQRITGTVTRITDFGAFVEIEPGIEGLIHISEMSWAKKVRHPSDLLKPGDRVDAVLLSIRPQERRIALGLKQALADPWIEAERNFPVGAQVEGPVTKLMNFGAFVEIAEGVEGLVHISEIVADRRLHHPGDVLRVGQRVKALVLAVDPERRQFRLSMRQLIPTSLDEFIAEQKTGDVVSGRVVELTESGAVVELGEGIRARCQIPRMPTRDKVAPAAGAPPGKADLSSLTSMLKARWKGNAPAAASEPEPLAEGQVRGFKIVKLDAESKRIEVEVG